MRVMSFLILSLLLGGSYVSLAGRTPMIFYFDLALILTLAYMAWNWISLDLSDRAIYWVAFVCVVTETVSTLANLADPEKGFYFLKTFIFGLLFYGIACRYRIRTATLALFLFGMGAISIVTSVHTALDNPGDIFNIKGEYDLGWATGNFVSSFLVLILPLVIVFSFRANGRRRIFYGVCAAVGLAGLLLTFSRGAIFALLAALIASIPMAYRAGFRFRHLIAGAALAALGVAGLASVVGAEGTVSSFEFLVAKTEEGDQNRLDLWRKAIETFEENPVLGVGPGQFVNYTEQVGFWGVKLNAHNSYLQILAEMGIVGLVPLLTLIGIVAWRAYKQARDGLSPLAIAIWIALFAGLLHNAVESTFYSLHFQILFWTLAAIVRRSGKNLPSGDLADVTV